MIRVLHVFKTAMPSTFGGVEMFMDTLCRATSVYGIENTIFSLANKPDESDGFTDQYKIILAKRDLYLSSTGFSWSALSVFGNLAKNADIIHYHFPNPFADFLHFFCRIRKPSIVTYHSDIVKQKLLYVLYRPLMKRFLGSVTRIVATSENYVHSSKVLSQVSSKISCIPIGINPAGQPDPERVRAWKAVLPIPFFLFVGAFRYYKGLTDALKAIEGTDLILVLAGGGPEEKKLKTFASAARLEGVTFLGEVSEEDKLALLSLCHAFVFPSNARSEAFGIALLEAASFGKPLISCEIGTATSFINLDMHTGLVIKPSSPMALRKAMTYLIDHPDEARQFGVNAKSRRANLFSADVCARSYIELYKCLASEM